MAEPSTEVLSLICASTSTRPQSTTLKKGQFPNTLEYERAMQVAAKPGILESERSNRFRKLESEAVAPDRAFHSEAARGNVCADPRGLDQKHNVFNRRYTIKKLDNVYTNDTTGNQAKHDQISVKRTIHKGNVSNACPWLLSGTQQFQRSISHGWRIKSASGTHSQTP